REDRVEPRGIEQQPERRIVRPEGACHAGEPTPHASYYRAPCAVRRLAYRARRVTKRRSTEPRKSPRQARAKVTVDAMLTAAARILKEVGYERASVNRIAEL